MFRSKIGYLGFFGLISFCIMASVGDVAAADSNKIDGVSIGTVNVEPLQEKVLASIGDKKFTKEGIQWRVDGLPADKRQQFQSDQQKGELLEKLIQNHLLALEAISLQLNKEKGVAAAIEDLIEYQLAQAYLKIKLSNIQILNEEIKKYYEEHMAEFMTPPMVKAQHILIKAGVNIPFRDEEAALKKANDIKKEADKGADFSELAKKYSEDWETRDKGGDVGFFSREMMIPDFTDAAFPLKTGQISKPVRSVLGYHIIKVTDRKDGAQMSFDEAGPTIVTTLTNMKKAARLEEEIEKLKKKYNVVYTK